MLHIFSSTSSKMKKEMFSGLLFVCVAICFTSAQNLGKNYGINLRLHQRGLDYATQKAVDEFYAELRSQPIPNFSGSSGKTTYSVTNIRVPELTKPTFTLRVNNGTGITANLAIARLTVTGNFRVQYKRGWIKLRKSGSFTARGSSISVATQFSVSVDPSGRPVTIVRSCSNRVGSFRLDIRASGLLGGIINLLEGRISRYLKGKIEPMLCEQVRKLNDRKLIPRLRKLKVTTTVQDDRLRLDYSLLRSPQFGSNYIDTTFKGDVAWKGRSTRTPTGTRSWPVISGAENKMVTIYITDYLMNALGYLLHNAGDLSYNVTRDKVSSKVRPRLSLSCSGDICAGTLLPEIASRYPDGWLEAGLRTSKPPRLTFENDTVWGNFSGVLEAFVATPDGRKVSVASVSAGLDIPLNLGIVGNKLIAKLETPRISVAGVDADTEGLERVLELVTTGFTNVELDKLISNGFSSVGLDKIGQRGIDLPTFDDITLVAPQIFIRSNLIVVSTDVRYN